MLPAFVFCLFPMLWKREFFFEMVELMKCMIIKKLCYCKILSMVVFCPGGDTVAREDIMDAIERGKIWGQC